MREIVGGVVINEIEAEPLSDYVIDFLKHQKNESPYLDFKLVINTDKFSDFPEIAKDIFAFSNYGGGWILIGWKEEKKSQFTPIGVPEDYKIDEATLQEKFNSFVDDPLQILYKETKELVNGVEKRFGFVFIPPSSKILTPIKDGKYSKDSKERVVFKKGAVFYRRGTQNISPPSDYELKILKNRLEQENYRISILSGEPDTIEESIESNLFEVGKLPKYVYLGNKKPYDDASIKFLLKQEGIFPEFYYKFKEWNRKIVTFENLQDGNNPYSKLVDQSSITRESVDSWIVDSDKGKLIIELLNRELKHYAMSKGLFYSQNRDKLYYPTISETRKESWKGRYSKSTRQVAFKMYAEQLRKFVYCHVAFYANFIKIGNKIFLRVLPTFILTENGKKSISGFDEGRVITRLSYDVYNNSYLNTILFWIDKLGDGKNILIRDYIEIDSKPASIDMKVGILFDTPSSELRVRIEDDEIKEMFDDDYEN